MVKAELKVADDYDPRFTRFDPLNPRKPATMDRGWFALQQDKTKAREIYHYNEAGDLVTYKDGIAGKIYRKADLPDGFDPRQVGSRMDDKLVDNAKIDEIMAHGNTDEGKKPVYERNPLYAMSNAVNDLIYSKARLEFFDKLINDKDYQKNVTTDRDTAEKRWGANNIMQVTGIQQLERNWYPKQVGRALEDLVRMGVNYSNNQAMEAISRFSQSALKPFYFIGPEVHVMNVLDKLVIGRGFDNLNVPKTIRNFTKGLEAIRRQGEDVDDFARAGGNPMFLHALTSRLMPNIAKELGVKIQEQHWKLDPLFKKAGINTKADYWEPTYQASNKMMWWQNDVLAMMLHYDNLDRHGGGHENWTKKFADLKKLNETKNPTAEQVKQRDELGKWKEDLLRTSVREVDKIVDSYIVPTTFGRSFGVGATSDWGRGVQKVLTEPAFANFGRFSWGLMNTLVNIGKNMAGRNENLSAGHSAALGFSQAAMMMGMLSVVYPLLSKAYQQMPWAKPDSKFEERGISNVVNIIPETIHKGVKDTWPKVARRALSPAIGVNLALTSYENRDNIGRPIMDSSGPGGWGAVPFQALGHIFDQIVSPAGQVSRAYAQEGAQFAAQRFIESNFGVKTPSEAQVKYEQKRPQTEIREGRSREKHPRGVFDLMGNKARQLVRGYEEGGPVTATETAGVIPTSRR
jgi:hypothetical protein